MLRVAYFANTKWFKYKLFEIKLVVVFWWTLLLHFFPNYLCFLDILCVLVLWMKVALALEGLTYLGLWFSGVIAMILWTFLSVCDFRVGLPRGPWWFSVYWRVWPTSGSTAMTSSLAMILWTFLCVWFQVGFATWPLMILCLLESVALVWVYGYDKFSCHDLMNISLCLISGRVCHVAPDDSLSTGECGPRLGLWLWQVLLPRSYEHISVSDFRVGFTGSIWWTRLLPRGLWWFCVYSRVWPSSGSTATTSSLAKILWTYLCVWFQGGFYWFHMMDTFVATWPLMILCVLESVALGWVYGYDKFSCHDLMNIFLCLLSGWVLLVPYDGHVCCHVASDDSVSTGERGPRLGLRLQQVLLPWSYEHLSVSIFRVGFTGSIWWTRLLPRGLWWFCVYWRAWPSSGSMATKSSLAMILWTFLCVWFQGGFYWFHMMDTFVATWPLMILCLLESVAFVWVDGYDKFSCHDLMNISPCFWF